MLYIVATPIGNLKDITLRAIDTLKECNFIIAENPSHSSRLLQQYDIQKKEMVQFADHNELRVLPKIIERLKNNTGCLVSDAGSPGISDPGFRLVRACVENNIPVIPVPGPSAVVTALTASGLPTDRFLFVGFLPKTEPKLVKILEEAKTVGATLASYESPQRLIKTLTHIQNTFPQAHIVIARELTKLHEEMVRGTSSEILSILQKRPTTKGEITLLVSHKK